MQSKRQLEAITEHREVSEKAIEVYLCNRVRSLGGRALKFYSNVEVGYPDRLVLLPNGIVFWVELKSKGKKPRPMQELAIARLERLGQTAFVCDSKEKVDEVLGGYEVQLRKYEQK